jgi:hypothetical protein
MTILEKSPVDAFVKHYGGMDLPVANGVSSSPQPVTNWNDVADRAMYCFKRVNNMVDYSGFDLTKNAVQLASYNRDIEKAFNDHLISCGILALNKIDDNAFSYVFDRKEQSLSPTMLKVVHQSSYKECPKFYLNFDDKGFVVGVKADIPKETNSLAQSELTHHGVKGQKWGVRNLLRKKKANQNKTMFQKAPTRLSDAELNSRIKRLELEKRYNELNKPTKSAGKAYTHSLLENSGRTVTGAIVGGAAGFFVKKYLTKHFGDAAKKAGKKALTNEQVIKKAAKFLEKHPGGFS